MWQGRLSSASDFLKQYAEPGVRLKTEMTDNGGCFDMVVTAQGDSLGAKECHSLDDRFATKMQHFWREFAASYTFNTWAVFARKTASIINYLGISTLQIIFHNSLVSVIPNWILSPVCI